METVLGIQKIKLTFQYIFSHPSKSSPEALISFIVIVNFTEF